MLTSFFFNFKNKILTNFYLFKFENFFKSFSNLYIYVFYFFLNRIPKKSLGKIKFYIYKKMKTFKTKNSFFYK
jgi:hypothetical protein